MIYRDHTSHSNLWKYSLPQYIHIGGTGGDISLGGDPGARSSEDRRHIIFATTQLDLLSQAKG